MTIKIGQIVYFNDQCPDGWENRTGVIKKRHNKNIVWVQAYENGHPYKYGKIEIEKLKLLKRNAEEEEVQ